MKIHYISCHSILEYDEVKLLTEMGHEVFSNGAYIDPRGHITLPRPGIPEAVFYEEYALLARENPKTKLPKELIEPFDVIIAMHTPEFITGNWERMKHKKVIWRSIGQSTPGIEAKLRPYRDNGMKVIRYSPAEVNIPNYMGQDAIIRFYKDPTEFAHWSGHIKQPMNMTQTLKGRREFVGYDVFENLTKVNPNRPIKVFGSGNEDLGPEYNAGEVTYDRMKQELRENRVYVYFGTWPACYTLSFIEAWMTGIPIVSVGHKTWNKPMYGQPLNCFEVPELFDNTKTGFYTDDINEMNEYITTLLKDDYLAREVSDAGRGAAILHFGKDSIKTQWEDFLNQ